MIPEIGHFALVIALALAIVQAAFGLVGAQTGRMALMATVRPVAAGQFLFILGAFVALAASFVGNDFSLVNVATNSNSTLPTQYRLAASWGSHEGSMLLWLLMLSGWTLAVALFSRHLPERLAARVIGILGLVSIGFLLFVLIASITMMRQPAPEAASMQ